MKKSYWIAIGTTLLGALVGYLYYAFFGCRGSCTIASSPGASMTFGAIAGLVFALPDKKKKKEDNANVE